jgi:hypothetical protein
VYCARNCSRFLKWLNHRCWGFAPKNFGLPPIHRPHISRAVCSFIFTDAEMAAVPVIPCVHADAKRNSLFLTLNQIDRSI